jgi:hypothetical protein
MSAQQGREMNDSKLLLTDDVGANDAKQGPQSQVPQQTPWKQAQRYIEGQHFLIVLERHTQP